MATGAEPWESLDEEALRRRGTAKWTTYGPDVLPAWIAEMDFPLAEPIVAALGDGLRRGATGYPPADAATGLPTALTGWLARHCRLEVEPEAVRIVPDILRGMLVSLDTFSTPRSPVIVMTPSYPPFFEVVRASGRDVIEVPMADDAGRPVPDFERISAALAAGAGTVILCNPHNPLGRVFSREELTTLSRLVESHSARVVADEVHAPLVYHPEEFVPYASISEVARRHSVTLTSASKGWNVPGLKCAAVLLTAAEDRLAWDRVSTVHTHGASLPGILANTVAFRDGGEWLRSAVAYLARSRQLVEEWRAATAPDITWYPPEGTYLAWLDLTRTGLPDPAAFLLERARVAVNAGAGFGRGAERCVRLNFATPRPILERVLDRIGTALLAR